MFTTKAGVKSDPPTVKIEPVKKKDGGNKKDKKRDLQYDVPGDVVQKMIEEKTIQNPEVKKYIKCWELDDYRRYSPGEEIVDTFLELEIQEHSTLIDWGCGSGRAAKKLYEKGPNLDVTAVDFAYNCLDDEVKAFIKEQDNFRFIEHDLTKKTDLRSEYGYCTDVMEHIPTEDVDTVLENILFASKRVFFQISTKEDIFSEHPDLDVEDDLHLTVEDYHWWLQKFSEQRCVVYRSIQLENAAIFYVTGWGEKSLNWNGGHMNVDVETIKENMIANAALGLKPIRPYEGDGETEVMLLCGGPTLNDFEDEIKQKRAAGVKCITVNGTYNWCLDRNIKPSLQCMIDAREFNKRFVEQVPGMTDETKYAIASQCDPSVFEIIPHERAYMWHVSLSGELTPHISKHFGEIYKDWFPSPGGSTVGLRALLLLRMLGFNKIYIYGMDSCVFEGRHHHAYEQKENDYLAERGTITIVIGGGTKWEKSFECQPWQAYQAREFEMMVKHMPKDIQLDVKGDGLIAYLIEANAKAAEVSELVS